MTNNNIATIDPNQSPFDLIHKLRSDGSEYWIARELMVMMGYPRWAKFENPIKSAIENLELNGDIVANHFLPLMVKSSGRDASDYELTRYAAYMTALCCDGRKPEVAAAKKYFATKAREAEVTQQFSIPATRSEALRLAADLEDQLEAEKLVTQQLLQEKQVLQLAIAQTAPKVELFNVYVSSDGWLTGEQIAKQFSVSTRKMFDLLRAEKAIFQRSGRNVPCARWVQEGWATMRPVKCHDSIVRSSLVFSHKALEQLFDLLRLKELIPANSDYQTHLDFDEPKQMKRA